MKSGGKMSMIKQMMTVLIAVTFTCSALFLMTSCATQDTKGEEGVISSPTTTTEEPEKDTTESVTGDVKRDEGAQAATRETKEVVQEIQAFDTESIYFDFDKSELKSAAQDILTKKATWLKDNPNSSIRIEGHCDERGTNEYNLTLGERRANAAKKFLRDLGISENRLTTRSYGEEKPAVYGSDESAWSKNRRDEFKLIQ
jgi:peptidoglycan-associated lipoprotein